MLIGLGWLKSRSGTTRSSWFEMASSLGNVAQTEASSRSKVLGASYSAGINPHKPYRLLYVFDHLVKFHARYVLILDRTRMLSSGRLSSQSTLSWRPVPVKTPVFVSFDFDNDRKLKDFIVMQARRTDSPFNIIDLSLAFLTHLLNFIKRGSLPWCAFVLHLIYAPSRPPCFHRPLRLLQIS